MSKEKHGISIGIDRIGKQFFVSMKAMGRLTHDDYEVIAPMIEAAIVKVNQSRVKVLFDATEFEGWEVRAAWDDFKLALNYEDEFDKIALYGNQEWQETAAKIGNWFMSGDVKYFDSYDDAISWLQN